MRKIVFYLLLGVFCTITTSANAAYDINRVFSCASIVDNVITDERSEFLYSEGFQIGIFFNSLSGTGNARIVWASPTGKTTEYNLPYDTKSDTWTSVPCYQSFINLILGSHSFQLYVQDSTNDEVLIDIIDVNITGVGYFANGVFSKGSMPKTSEPIQVVNSPVPAFEVGLPVFFTVSMTVNTPTTVSISWKILEEIVLASTIDLNPENFVWSEKFILGAYIKTHIPIGAHETIITLSTANGNETKTFPFTVTTNVDTKPKSSFFVITVPQKCN